MRASLSLLVLGAACGSSSSPAGPPPAPAKPTPIADGYRDVAAKIIAAATADDAAWQRLRELTDGIGNRLSGTPALDRAIAWAADAMKADGLDVTLEKTMVPRWVRGAESAKLVTPIERDLVMLGLGGSVATPDGGITAPVLVVTSWDDLDRHAADAKGKIVVYDVAMPPWSDETGSHYGDVVGYRWQGASRAAKYGAVAALVRSVTAHSLRTPHTGSMGYDKQHPELPKIPAAAITVEDAELIHRLVDAGKPVTVHLEMSAKTLDDVPSANVIGELRGTSNPDEVVVLGAHLDSWDVGQGAQDDGSGDVGVMGALRVLKQLGLRPRRTIRVVLYVNEENGLRGGKQYAEDHKADLAKHVLAIEMDGGAYAPVGFDVDDGVDDDARKAHGDPRLDRILAHVTDLESLLVGLGATRARAGEAGADIGPLAAAGVPALGMATDARTYFDTHHTQADTLDKVDPKRLAECVASLAVIAYVAADMPGRIDDP